MGKTLKKTLTLALCLILCAVCVLADAAPALAEGEEDSLDERVAAAQKAIRTLDVGKYGMVPVYGRDVADGVYDVRVDSSSPFFRILEAQLIVENHEMTARITISSLSYQWVYSGTAEQAENDGKENYIGYEEDDGHGVFTIPVEALDKGVLCAAFSKRRKRWYDRTLVFYASSLPEGAVDLDLPDLDVIEAAVRAYEVKPAGPVQMPEHEPPEAVTVPRSDGEYSIEVNMTGGSGRASISSPTLLIVRDGRAYARLLWSSSYYDYMILEDEVYHNQTTDGGNSVFEIPITAMDEGIPVIADTTAMGDPVEIQYVLTFYAESIGSKSQIPQNAALKVLILAAAIILAGGVANHFIKKKRK